MSLKDKFEEKKSASIIESLKHTYFMCFTLIIWFYLWVENKLYMENSIQSEFKLNCKPYQKNPYRKVMQIYDFNI